MLVNITYYIDVLKPNWILSLALQKKEVNAVNSANYVVKTKSEFRKLKRKPVELYPSIAYLNKILLKTVTEKVFLKV